MQILITRCNSGFQGRAITSSGLVVLSVLASTWFDAWHRLARVLSFLRIRYSLKIQY